MNLRQLHRTLLVAGSVLLTALVFLFTQQMINRLSHQVTSTSRKPLSIALEEIEVGKIEWERIDVEAEEAAAALAVQEAAAAKAALLAGDAPTSA